MTKHYLTKPMMSAGVLAMVILFFLLAPSFGADGLVSVKSPFSVAKTMDRLESTVQQKGMKVFVRIDHAKGAESIGKSLRATEVILFGNPQGGTPFMECAQTVAIDLPLKALAWKDETGQVWLGYNDPGFLAQRHGVPECKVVDNMSKALASIAASVTSP